jgi:Ca-activated chloride channel family protein
MRRYLPVLALVLAWCAPAGAHGLLIPEEKSLPPLAMLNHKVSISIEDQVAITKVEQTFRNHTDRQLEATYVFPVPKGASVNKFVMTVNGKDVKGELVEADKARQIYANIVRRTQDPGLLEYMGRDLLRMRVFPVPPKGDQKVTLSYEAVGERSGDLAEYVYPLKTDGKATATLEAFSIEATIKSQHAVQNVYSPTHAIAIKRQNDKQVTVTFERNQGLLDKDFQLFYQLGDKDVGLTALTHRPISTEPGYFMLLVTPKVEMKKEYQVPRDMVLVLDTSGSMRENGKMEQAKKALNYCLNSLDKNDRFALVNFATTVNRYKDGLLPASSEQVEQARKWVNNLDATGGTAINDALASALELRSSDPGRTFTIVFFTDGQPTIGETNIDKILKNTFAKNTTNTRIFSFGVGDDVNASFLDQLSEGTRAVSTYVRPQEDIEAKVSALYSKIAHPVLANLKIAPTNEVSFSEVYPAQLPDLFHGQQLIVFGRFSGRGPSALKLTGTVGMEAKEFAYDLTFPEKTGDEHGFVEEIWARRKVGYLLDQIRANGEKKELKDEVIALAKKYGITTPYTSYLIVPDGPAPVVTTGPKPQPGVAFNPYAGGGLGGGFGGLGGGLGGFNGGSAGVPAYGLLPKDGKGGEKPQTVASYAQAVNGSQGGQMAGRVQFETSKYKGLDQAPKNDPNAKTLEAAAEKLRTYDAAQQALARHKRDEVQAGKLGVDLAVQMNNLRNQSQVEFTALRQVNGRNCLEVGGVWIDDGFTPKTPYVTVKAQSEAYFRILELHPKVKDVFRLGNYLVWMTPSGTALIVDAGDGKEKLSDDDINKLFVAKK